MWRPVFVSLSSGERASITPRERDPRFCVRAGTHKEKIVEVVAGVDLGGTAVNYTLVDREEKFLIDGLCEHPFLDKQGPEVCLKQIEDGLRSAAGRAGAQMAELE